MTVVDAAGAQIGELLDVVALCASETAVVTGFLVARDDDQYRVSWAHVAEIDVDAEKLHLSCLAADLEHASIRGDELALVESVLDKHGLDKGELVAADRGMLEIGGEAREVELLGVDVDLRDVRPRHTILVVVALDEEAGDHGGLGGAQGDHIEQLADLRAGGVDHGHVFEFGEGERTWVVVHGNESHPFACGDPRGTRRGYPGGRHVVNDSRCYIPVSSRCPRAIHSARSCPASPF